MAELGDPAYVPPTPPPWLELVDVWVARVEKRQCSVVVRSARRRPPLPLSPFLAALPPPPPPSPFLATPRVSDPRPRPRSSRTCARPSPCARSRTSSACAASRPTRTRTARSSEVLVCDAAEGSAAARRPPRPPTRARAASGLALESARVPGQAPRTREQWAEWNAVWPIVWQQPSSHLAGAEGSALRRRRRGGGCGDGPARRSSETERSPRTKPRPRRRA